MDIPSLPSVPNVGVPNVSLSKVPEIKISKLPVKITKIDVMNGKGVPGGFDAASVKLPSAETTKLIAATSAISAKAGSITSAVSAVKSGAIPSIPGLMAAQGKIGALKTKYANKLKDMVKVPDFTKKLKLPTPPRLPSIPDFKSLSIPELPSVPLLPNASLPSIRG